MADCVPPTSVAISLTHNLFSNKTFIIFTLVESANTLNSSAISWIFSGSCCVKVCPGIGWFAFDLFGCRGCFGYIYNVEDSHQWPDYKL